MPSIPFFTYTYTLAIVVGFGASLSPLRAQTTASPAEAGVTTPTPAELRLLVEEALDSFGVPGLSVGIYYNDHVVLSEGFGFRESGKPEPVDGATLFAIASNTKAFVGTTAAILAGEREDFALTDRVTAHLPYLDFADPHVTALANVTDLMSHRIGLGTFKGDHLWWKRELTPRQVLGLADGLELEYPFRAGYGYSNIGFLAAGEVISAVAGMPFEEVMRDKIFGPLNMDRTVMHVADLPSHGNYATGHVTRQGNAPIAPVAWDTPGAAGDIWSSSDDMLKWLAANLHEGVVGADTIWSASAQRVAMRPHNTFGGKDDFTSYGLGWFMRKAGEHTVVSHGGGYDGMYSQVQLVPSVGFGVVVLTNSMTGAASTIATEIRSRFLGEANEDWLSERLARSREADARWFARQDSVDRLLATQAGKPNLVNRIIGSYTDDQYGTFRVMANNSALELHFANAPGLTASLESAGGDHYRLKFAERHAWLERGIAYFTPSPDGDVLRLFIPNDDIFYDTIAATRD